MATRRALVLAGGGIAGIAWETGVLRGIADESPAAARLLLDSDVLVGTSAGSAVAAQIGSGSPLDGAVRSAGRRDVGEIDSGVDVDDITELFLTALSEPYDNTLGRTRQQMQRIGAVALATETVPEPVRREVIAQRLPSHDWPDRVLRITAIDTATGELVVFDRESGVELVDAVAASCAVPGAWPPVTIAGRRYMDGGVASSVNLGVGRRLRRGGGAGALGGRRAVAVRRRAGRRDRGVRRRDAVFAVFADDDSLAAFGPNPAGSALPRRFGPGRTRAGPPRSAAVARFLGV